MEYDVFFSISQTPVKGVTPTEARLFVETVRTGGESFSPIQDAVKDLEVAEEYIRRLCEWRTSQRTRHVRTISLS